MVVHGTMCHHASSAYTIIRRREEELHVGELAEEDLA